MKKFFATTGALMLLACSACAGPARKPATHAAKATKATKAVKLTDVNVCPMTMEAVHGKGVGHSVVGSYDVHFCCGGCKPEFDKLSKPEQQKKIQAALKVQHSAKHA
jgi:hypothetical protein